MRSFLPSNPSPPRLSLSEYKPRSTVEHIFQTVETWRLCGIPDSTPSSFEFSVSPQELEELEKKVSDSHKTVVDFWDRAIRYNYLSSESLLIMKVLTRKHEIAGAEIVKSIRQQLDIMSAIATQIVKDFIADIREEASAGVVALETTAVAGDKHCPDGSFTFRLAEFPSVVIEVVHSQLFKDLRKIAESYILGSKGETRVVLGLDITYKGTKKAPSKRGMVSTWVSNGQGQDVDHPHVVEYGIKKKIFRDADGNCVNPEQGITIPLTDFCPKDFLPAAWSADVKDIFISNAELHRAAVEAEKKMEGAPARKKVLEQKKCFDRKRVWSESSDQEDDEGDDSGTSPEPLDCNKDKRFKSSARTPPPSDMTLRSRSGTGKKKGDKKKEGT